MADFGAGCSGTTGNGCTTGLGIQLNTGTNGTPVWTSQAQSGTGIEFRWSDSSAQGTVASASWPLMTRPGSNQTVPFLYAFSADTTSLGSLGTTSNTPVTFSNANWAHSRMCWDATGTFGSAPILTAYQSSAHAAISRNSPTNDLLAGGADTVGGGSLQRSYFKACMWGRVTSAGAPGAAPTTAPLATDGSTGSLVPTAGANWSLASGGTNGQGQYQGLMGDVDWLTAAATPAATTVDSIALEFCLFTGPNQNTGTYTLDAPAVKYTFS